MRTFPAFFSPLRFLLLFLVGKTSHRFLYFGFLAKALCSPEVLTEAGLRINPNKRIKVGGVVGGDVCIASFGKVFWFFLCFDVQGSWSATSLQPWQMGLGEKWEFCSQETNQNVRSMFALYLSKIMEITVYPSSCCSSHIQAQMIIKCNQNTLHLRWKN